MGPAITVPHLVEDRVVEGHVVEGHVVAVDGYRLPLRVWRAAGDVDAAPPEAVILAVHGFNDYGRAFDNLAEPLVENLDMTLYSYDQRGFGATDRPGIWPGTETLVSDLATVIRLLHERYPESPLYLMGESMGAGVVMLALDRAPELPVDGVVLLAPAVWGLDTMPWYQRLALWLGMRLMPERTFSGDTARRLGISPSDDEAIMRALALDPLVLKQARVDTLHGVTLLMGEAARVERLPVPALVQYGDNDQIIPPRPVCEWLRQWEPAAGQIMALYPDGYHMLTRYSGRNAVIEDLAHWLSRPPEGERAELPSGFRTDWAEAREAVCSW